jgi:integrase/recombinase XerD
MGTVGEFLSWCCLQGWVPPTLVNALTQPKYLPAGFDAGEDGQNRTVMARTIKFRVAVPGYEWLSDEEIGVLLGLARHARGAFLIQLLAESGIRIGLELVLVEVLLGDSSRTQPEPTSPRSTSAAARVAYLPDRPSSG